ncbi:membrane protein [Bacillus gaemokensis]|uniref:Membrane protein n=2 Tax=Bacillus gaemokensis TaxID=574375 RepID=A0A073KL55_9BACI|nr:membrane protein [Bacillus gaemokensis]
MKKKQYSSITFIKALLLTIVLGMLAYIIDIPIIRVSLIGMTLVLGAISHGMMLQLYEAGLDDMKEYIDKK